MSLCIDVGLTKQVFLMWSGSVVKNVDPSVGLLVIMLYSPRFHTQLWPFGHA